MNTPTATSDAWMNGIDVHAFIQQHYTPYEGDAAFLCGPTKRTTTLWQQVLALQQQEQENGGVLDVDTVRPSTITSHPVGYIQQEKEVIVGLQTDAPLKRAIKPRGGVRLVKNACAAYGHTLDAHVEDMFSTHITSHNEAVFRMYKHWDDFHTPDGKLLRSKGVITGLPDNYGRGRIIGDYRRVALYGIDFLLEQKQQDLGIEDEQMLEEDLRRREEVGLQIEALEDMVTMASTYGYDIRRPAETFTEAVQWLYFAYLAAVKEQDGAAMSLGRIDAFLDVYAQRDLEANIITEEQVQEVLDDFVIKLRIVKQLRVPEYNEIFAGDPTWVTCALAGHGEDGRTLVTKTTFRLLHSLTNLGPSPEPNLTVLWSEQLPSNFKNYASTVAIQSSALQFENDDIMRPDFGDDYGIACCVSAMKIGKQMQFFGARCNLAKLLLLAINEGKDEFDANTIINDVLPLNSAAILDYNEVRTQLSQVIQWMAKKYVATMNVIHFTHDRYYYEKGQMALHDTEVERMMAFGVAGFSVLVDSLAAIKYATVHAIRNQDGIATEFTVEGEYPTYGTDDDRVDEIAIEIVKEFLDELKKHPTYRNAKHTLSLLTITSNVLYGKHTGATPDGRAAGSPFAPGANPMHNRDSFGAISSLNSVAKIPYGYCSDGISNTFSITPTSLGKTATQRTQNLTGLLDGYFQQKAHHLNVNVLDRALLEEAMAHPELHPQLVLRVSGYTVRFVSLNKQQQTEIIARTFHENM